MADSVIKSQTVNDFRGSTALSKLAEKSGRGKHVYFDELGLKSADGSSINMREDLQESGNWQETFEEINESIKSTGVGFSVKDAIKEALDTGRVSLPVFTAPEIFVSDRQDLPVKDALARVAVSQDEVRLDEVTEVGEPTSETAEVDTVSTVNDTIQKYKYNIKQVYVRKEISDKIVHTDRYDPQTLKTELASEGIARYLEKQAINGTENNASGMDGLADWVPASNTFDATDESVSEELFRDATNVLDVNSVANSDQMVVCDHQTFKELKNALGDLQRFNQPQEEYSFGALALEVDGKMINPSHGIEDTPGRDIFAFDASAHAWYYLQETTAKFDNITQTNDTTEEMVVYEMVVFGSEGRQNIARVENIGETSA